MLIVSGEESVSLLKKLTKFLLKIYNFWCINVLKTLLDGTNLSLKQLNLIKKTLKLKKKKKSQMFLKNLYFFISHCNNPAINW